TGPGNGPDHPFWRLLNDLRARWRTDLISSLLLEGGLFVVLSKADAATAPDLVNAIFDIFDKTRNERFRRTIVELMEQRADWVCGNADTHPQMWVHGYRPVLPDRHRIDYRSGIACIAVERLFQYDVRWRAGSYDELPQGPFARIVFPTNASVGLELDLTS